MPIRLYMDHHVPRVITNGLRSRGVDVMTSHEDKTSEWDDAKLLDRATELERVLFTRDYNLLQEAVKWQRSGVKFAGVIYAHQLRVSIGDCIRGLEIAAKAGEPEDLRILCSFCPSNGKHLPSCSERKHSFFHYGVVY